MIPSARNTIQTLDYELVNEMTSSSFEKAMRNSPDPMIKEAYLIFQQEAAGDEYDYFDDNFVDIL